MSRNAGALNPQAGRNDGKNPYGECDLGHAYFRGGCPACASDMVTQYEDFPEGDKQ